MKSDADTPKKSLLRRVFDFFDSVAMLGSMGIGIVVIFLLSLLVGLFYQEENWRGKRAWERAQAKDLAAGKIVDVAKVFPPTVEDEDNFFKAPEMANWFAKRGGMNMLLAKLDYRNFEKMFDQRDTAVARVTIVSPGTLVDPHAADLVLRYEDSMLTVFDGSQPITNAVQKVIPVIAMDEVPLSDAIKQLAGAANVKYRLDPKLRYGQPDENGVVPPQPTVSINWTNLTGMRAFKAVLANYNLRMVPNPATGIARIMIKDPAQPFINTNLTAQLTRLVQEAVAPATNTVGDHIAGIFGVQISVQPMGKTKPARIVVISDGIPKADEVRSFFPRYPLGYNCGVNWGSQAQVRLEGSDTYQVNLYPPPRIAAADYLAWSDQFEPEFDEIREALKRPYARMDGDYSDPRQIPTPDFTSLRVTAQTLAQRAQCHLLLSEPEKALPDLMLLRDLCRVFEARPAGKPVTILSAMYNTTLTGMYVSLFGEGMRRHAWRETELAALEQQMKEINLPPFMLNGLEIRRLAACRDLETVTADDWQKMLDERYRIPNRSPAQNLREQLRDPCTRLLLLAPRGWVYQNMALVSELNRTDLIGYDPATGLFQPHRSDKAVQNATNLLDHKYAFSMLAAEVMHAGSSSLMVAHNQTLVNEARVVCALERHRLAHGNYPETLDALVPQFIDELPRDLIGGQPLKYHRDGDQFTLYSVGWNEVDDQGVSFVTPDDWWTDKLSNGDWVWLWGKKIKSPASQKKS